MKLKIFKGFNKDFLSKLDCEPLYESPIEMKFNIFKLDDIYKDELEENLILKKNSDVLWVTYEEYELIYEMVNVRASSGKITVEVINNNIYPEIYPTDLEIDEDLYLNYKKSIEDTSKKNNDNNINILNKFYSRIEKYNDVVYVSFNEIDITCDKIYVKNEKELNKYLTNNNLSLWKNIATIKILQTYAKYTTENYETIFTKLNKNLLGKEYTREETAYDLIKQIYPNEISKNYNNKYLSDDTKNYISNLTNEIIKEYEDMINTSWMDNETKSKAVTKLNNIKINIGTSYIKDLSSYYDFDSNISLVKNIINLNKVVRTASYEMLDTTTTTNALPDYTFNAYYDVTSNSINILTGSTKVIKDINNKYENLGSIGFIISHEISHAFDNNGSKFDENGFLSNWYTTSSQEKYQEIQNKVIDYYNNYEIIHNVSNNGTRTIGENIADLGAMECITNILIRNNANKKDYQTTYESFAKVWANNYSKSTKVLQSLIDTHSPNEIRVNGVLSSTKKFYETYKIDSKDLMYIEPEKRVNIWS